MKLDPTFAREIKKIANGDGSLEAKFAFMELAKKTKESLSAPEVARGGYEAAMSIYGRVPVAICTAATLYRRYERLGGWGSRWAFEVLDLWTNRSPSAIDRVVIRDDMLHPTRICDYAAAFIKQTLISD